jgi:hypothetical protein
MASPEAGRMQTNVAVVVRGVAALETTNGPV